MRERKDHCRNGHLYTPETTHWRTNARGTEVRNCRICRRESDARRNDEPAPATATHCKNGHEYTPENTGTKKNGEGRIARSCKTCRAAANKRKRAAEKKRAADPRGGATRGLKPGQRITRYDYDVWVVDGRLYVKATAREYERANDDAFRLAARRHGEKWLQARGLDPKMISDQLDVWDVAKNWADMLPEAITYRTKDAILGGENEDAAAA